MSQGDTLEIMRAIGRLEGKLDGLLALEPRVSKVEQKVSGVLGWAAGAGATSAFVISILLRVI